MELTKKQNDIIEDVRKHNPKITVLYGGKRAGKTFLSILMFLSHIAFYENEGLSFIVGGVNQSALERNVLNEIEDILNIEIKLNKSGAFNLFGNSVYCFDGANASSWKKVRGFTAAGAYLNEATALHDTFIKEVISRCSYTGSRIIMDTNPENPGHPVKKDYIDQSGQKLKSGRMNILAYHFTLFDNDTLDEEYVESIVQSTPSGAFSDRDIYGRWVAREGAVFTDFGKHNYISDEELSSIDFDKVMVGVDWGYDHYGTMLVVGRKGDTYYILEEHAHRFRDIEYWASLANRIQDKYGGKQRIPFYCDSARAEYVARLRNEGINAMNANKAVIVGIATLATLFKNEKIKVPIHRMDKFQEEINNYIWDSKKDAPKKENDDIMDALRYAVYTDFIGGATETDYETLSNSIKMLGL